MVNFNKGFTMKKSNQILAIASLAMALVTPAIAAGAYDGIYQSTANSKSYATVHQSGTSIIVAAFDIDSVSGVSISGSFGRVTGNLSTWELYQGSISGSHATVIGEGVYGSCKMGSTINFDAAGNAIVTITSLAQTAKGMTQNVNCWANSTVGAVIKFNRAF
jgi:hypothetical protein